MSKARREFLEGAGAVAAGAALVSKLPYTVRAAAQTSDFDINRSFDTFMQGIGGSAADGGGNVKFIGQDPLLRSHFRIGSSMAIPAMAAAVGAAAIWKDRTGEGQDAQVDLRGCFESGWVAGLEKLYKAGHRRLADADDEAHRPAN